MAQTVDRDLRALVGSGLIARARKIGDAFPDVDLIDSRGARVRLLDKLAKGPLVVVFYRGEGGMVPVLQS